MKHIIFLMFIILTNTEIYSQSENEIYKQVINDFIFKFRQPNIDYSPTTTLIVIETPVYMNKLNVNDYLRFKKKYKKFDQQTFTNFIEKSQVELQIKNIKISGVEFEVIDKELSKNRGKLDSLYPNWNHSIIEFSNIGFNQLKNQAFVYYGFDSGPGFGGGIYILYKKKRLKWKKIRLFPAWGA